MFLIAVAAPAAFQASPDSTTAANVVGAMLTRWHYLAIAAPLALFALEWRRNRAIVVSLLFAALLFACTQGIVDVRIRFIRESVAVSSLDRDDPVRRAFGMLHGLSMMLMALQVVIAAITVWMNARKTVFVETDLEPVADDAVAPAAAVPYVPPPAPQPVADVAPDTVPAVPPALPSHVVTEEMTETTAADLDNTIYIVVINASQQYSIWPADREIPLGWTDAGFHGPKTACLTYIEQHWQSS